MAMQRLTAILTAVLLAGTASAQWTPRTDQTGYTYYESGANRAYPSQDGFFYVYDYGDERYQLIYPEGHTFYIVAQLPPYRINAVSGVGLWFKYGGRWVPYTQAHAYAKVKEWETYWQGCYRDLLANPGHMYYHAKNHASKLLFDTVKVIAMPLAPTSER